MKITEINVFLVGRWQFVKVQTDEGLYGVGEGGGWPFVSATAINVLKQTLIGENPLDIERLWYKMYMASVYYGRRGAAIQVISGIDIALWDIIGKALEMPVYKVLGGVRPGHGLWLPPSDPAIATNLHITRDEGLVRGMRFWCIVRRVLASTDVHDGMVTLKLHLVRIPGPTDR